MIMSSCLPMLRHLRKRGKVRRRTKQWGACGSRTITDAWQFPKGKEFLFPNRKGSGPMTKDIVCHNIVRARKTFRPSSSLAAMLDTSKIRSHSARHRRINDFKSSGCSPEVAMVYARIKHKKTFDAYGRLDQAQSGKALQQNKVLQKMLKSLYPSP